MRSFSIIALCLVAASVKAQNSAMMANCAEDELTTRVYDINEEMNEFLDKISKAGSNAKVASKIRDTFAGRSNAFKNAVQNLYKKAHEDNVECQRKASATGRRACTTSMLSQIAIKVTPMASAKVNDLVKDVNEIADKFRGNSKAASDNISSKARDFGRNMMAALNKCSTMK